MNRYGWTGLHEYISFIAIDQSYAGNIILNVLIDLNIHNQILRATHFTINSYSPSIVKNVSKP